MTLLRAMRVAAIVMLLLAIPQQGEDFYKALRFTIVIAAALEVWDIQKSFVGAWGKTLASLFFIAVAILFNPIEPMAFIRETWIAIDAAVILVLLGRFRRV